MKRLIRPCLVLVAVLILSALTGVQAESASFEEIAGDYTFASGVGAWSTELTIYEDGSFIGYFHDSDFEEGVLDGVSYQGVTYYCDFYGSLSNPVSVGSWELDCSVTELSWDPDDVYVEDGVRYEPADPYGMSQGAFLRFYREGTSRGMLPGDFVDWVRLQSGSYDWQTLTSIGFYNETDGAGFCGYEDSGNETSQQMWGSIGDVSATVTPAAEPEGLRFPVEAEVVNCSNGFATIRTEPSFSGEILARVDMGDTMEVYSNEAYRSGKHWFVETGCDGVRGYTCIEYLDIILPDYVYYQTGYLQGTAGTVSATDPTTDLLMRSGPGSSYDELGLLYGGEVLGYLGQAQLDTSGVCWYYCSYYGDDCWISAKYTTLTLNNGKRYTRSKGIF